MVAPYIAISKVPFGNTFALEFFSASSVINSSEKYIVLFLNSPDFTQGITPLT